MCPTEGKVSIIEGTERFWWRKWDRIDRPKQSMKTGGVRGKWVYSGTRVLPTALELDGAEIQ